MEYPSKTASSLMSKNHLSPAPAFGDEHSRSSRGSVAEDLMSNLMQNNAGSCSYTKDFPLCLWNDLLFPQLESQRHEYSELDLHSHQRDGVLAPSSEVDLSSKSAFLNKFTRKQCVGGPWIQNTFFHFPIGSAESQILPRMPITGQQELLTENEYNSNAVRNQLYGGSIGEIVLSSGSSSSLTLSPKADSSYESTSSLNDMDWPLLSMASWIPKNVHNKKNSTVAPTESRNQSSLHATMHSFEFFENDSGIHISNKKNNFGLPSMQQQRRTSAGNVTYEAFEHHPKSCDENYHAMLKMCLKKLTKKCGNTQKATINSTNQERVTFDERDDDREGCDASPAGTAFSYPTVRPTDKTTKKSKNPHKPETQSQEQQSFLENHAIEYCKTIIDHAAPIEKDNAQSTTMDAIKNLPITTKTTAVALSEIQTLIPSPHWTLPTLNSHVPPVHKASQMETMISPESRLEYLISEKNTREFTIKEKASELNSQNETEISVDNSPSLPKSVPKSNETKDKFNTASNETLISFSVDEPQKTPPENLSRMSLLYKRSNMCVSGGGGKGSKINKLFSSETDLVNKDQKQTLGHNNNVNNECQHPNGCKPCAFHWTKGCINGKNCQFCHEWHTPKKKKPMKEQKNLMIIARPDGKIEFFRCSVEEALKRS